MVACRIAELAVRGRSSSENGAPSIGWPRFWSRGRVAFALEALEIMMSRSQIDQSSHNPRCFQAFRMVSEQQSTLDMQCSMAQTSAKETELNHCEYAQGNYFINQFQAGLKSRFPIDILLGGGKPFWQLDISFESLGAALPSFF
jgi:hypothetical protein